MPVHLTMCRQVRAMPAVDPSKFAGRRQPHNSQLLLVKAALHGGDPNWGRIVQAVGQAVGEWGPGQPPLAVDIAIEGMQVCSAGAAIGHDAAALSEAVRGEEVEYEITLPGDGHETELFFSDLSHEYVSINADYTT